MLEFDETVYNNLINVECSDTLIEQIKKLVFDESIFDLNKRDNDAKEHELYSDMDEPDIFETYGVSEDSSDKFHEKCINFAMNHSNEYSQLILKLVEILSGEGIPARDFIISDEYYRNHKNELKHLRVNETVFWMWLYSKCCSIFTDENIKSH